LNKKTTTEIDAEFNRLTDLIDNEYNDLVRAREAAQTAVNNAWVNSPLYKVEDNTINNKDKDKLLGAS